MELTQKKLITIRNYWNKEQNENLTKFKCLIPNSKWILKSNTGNYVTIEANSIAIQTEFVDLKNFFTYHKEFFNILYK